MLRTDLTAKQLTVGLLSMPKPTTLCVITDSSLPRSYMLAWRALLATVVKKIARPSECLSFWAYATDAPFSPLD